MSLLDEFVAQNGSKGLNQQIVNQSAKKSGTNNQKAGAANNSGGKMNTGGTSLLDEFIAQNGTKGLNPQVLNISTSTPKSKKRTSTRKPGEIRALGAGDYGAGSDTRLDNIISAGGYLTASGIAKLGSLLAGGTGELTMGQSAQAAVKGQNQQKIEAQKKSEQGQKTKAKLDELAHEFYDTAMPSYEKATAPLKDSNPLVKLTKAMNNGELTMGESVQAAVNGVSQQKAEEAKRARQNTDVAGKLGRIAGELGINATQMAIDAITGPASLVTMGARATGSRALELEELGKSETEQLIGGLTSGLIEVMTEKIGGPFEKIYGKTALGKVTSKFVNSLGKSPAGKAALKIMSDFVSEGMEEVLSDFLNPIADKLTGISEADWNWDEMYGDTWADEWAHDFLVGGILGMTGGGANLITESISTNSEKARVAEQIVNSGKTGELLEKAYMAGGKAEQLADEYSNDEGNSRKLSDIYDAIQAQTLSEAVSARLDELGAEDSATAADSLVSYIMGKSEEAPKGKAVQRVRTELTDALNGNLLSTNEWALDAIDVMSEFSQNMFSETATAEPENMQTVEAPAEEAAEDVPVEEAAEFTEDSQFAGTWDANNIVESMFPEEVKSGILTASEVASIQSMDLNDVENMVREYIATKEIDNGRDSMDGSLGRDSGESAEGEGRAVRERAEGDKGQKSGGGHRADSRGESLHGETESSTEGKVSSRELGLKDGTDEKTVSVVPERKWTTAEKQIAKAFGPASNGFTIVSNNLSVAGGKVNGAKTKDGKIIVSRSSRLYKAEQLMIHEGGHLYIDDDAELRDKLRGAAVDALSEREIDELTAQYALKWKGLYKGDAEKFDRAANGELDAQELEEFSKKYVTEVLCDALAGIDRADTKGTSRFSEAVRAAFKEETGIDVDSLLNGRESKAQTDTKETEGKNKPAEPRNNGPPSESYSYAGERAETADRLSLDNAKQMLADDIDPEIIREQTGWFKGMDGKWRFEIDDSEMKVSLDGFFTNPDVIRYNELEKKFINGDITETEAEKLRNLDAALKGVKKKPFVLGDYVQHDALFKAYPELEDYLISFRKMDAQGAFNTSFSAILLNDNLKYNESKLKKTLIHEMQHAIQAIEGFETGTNLDNATFEEYWNTAGEIEARDVADRSELTAEERKNTRPDIDRADVVFADSNESYSIDENLEYELYDVYNGTFDSSKNEVHIGTASNFITDVIGAEAFDNYMPAEKAYRAMATEEKAIFDGKPTGKNINYHGLGVDGLKRILEASENPIAAFADTPSVNNKRENRIVLVTDEAAQGGLGIVILEVDAKALNNGKIVKANKTITVYPKNNITRDIMDAAANGRLLHLDKKRSQAHLTGMKGANYPTAVRKADFTNNIRRFWENVKWKKSGKAEMSFESGIEAEPEWKKKLREYDSFSIEEETLTAEEVQRRKEFQSTVNKESLTKLRERQSRLEGRMQGYMRTDNLTEQMKTELEQMKADHDAVLKAIEKKQQKAEQARQVRAAAKEQATEKATQITEAQGRNRSKQRLADSIIRNFSIQDGKMKAAEIINEYADKYYNEGKISRSDVNALFNTLMRLGTVEVEAEAEAREMRRHLAGTTITVPQSVIEEFGDDWNSFRQRAFGSRIILSKNHVGNQIDTFTKELAVSFGEGTFDDSADLKTQLEKIVEVAEEGRAEKMDLYQMAEYIRKREGKEASEAINDELYDKLVADLKNYAENAKFEMDLTYKNAYQMARDKAQRAESYRMAQENKHVKERQREALKQVQHLKKMRDKTSSEYREKIDEIIRDINTISLSAANLTNYSVKYDDVVGNIVGSYKKEKAENRNFLPDEYCEKLIERIENKSISEMTPEEVEDLIKAAIAVRTEIYNSKNIIGSATNMAFDDAFEDNRASFKSAEKPKKTYGEKWAAKRAVMNPIHYLECLSGWNRESTWFKTFAKGLENGEVNQRRYAEQSKQMLDDFVSQHHEWLKHADGQGKNGIWYELEVSPVVQWGKGDQPIFGTPVKVYMTPIQKAQLYLESKNYDNLRHMSYGGRVFCDKELYSKGKKSEAWSNDPIRLAPETVRKITADLTAEEMELANALEKYYNQYAKTEINKISNALHGYDRAMASNYAPIFTRKTFNETTPAIIDGTAEGVGHLKERVKGATTPSINISCLDAFNKHVSQTSRYVGMSIPIHDMNTMLNWYKDGKTMRQVISQEWSDGDVQYIDNLIKDLNGGVIEERNVIEELLEKARGGYIGATFAFNPSVALKVFGSFGTASAELGFENVKGAFSKTSPELIRKYTSEYDVRVRGYSSPEVARMTESGGLMGKIQDFSHSKSTAENETLNKLGTAARRAVGDTLGGGLMVRTDAMVAKAMWGWAEEAVRNEQPDLEIGTQEQVDNGTSPFYKAVAEKYNTAIGNTQSEYDIMHRSQFMKSTSAMAQPFVMFRTDIMQCTNLLMKAKGESEYYQKALKEDPENESIKDRAGKNKHLMRNTVIALLTSSLIVAVVTSLTSLFKRRDDYYEDGELNWGKIGVETAANYLEDLSGMIPIGDNVINALVEKVTGGKWYDIELMGLDTMNDLINDSVSLGEKIVDNSAELKDFKALASVLATTFGLPVNNVEKYTLGLLSWVSPAVAEAYNNFWSEPNKATLKGKTGEMLQQDVYGIYNEFGLEREQTNEIARLYDAGYDKIILGSAPKSITIDGTSYDLDKDALNKYNETAFSIQSQIGDIISSSEYQDADDETRAEMLKRINTYASEVAKKEAVPEYSMPAWATSCEKMLESGESIMTVAMMPYEKQKSSGTTESEDPRYVKFIKSGIEYNNARDIEEILTALTPAPESSSVTQLQKISAIAHMTIPENEKSAAIEIIYGSGSEKKYAAYKSATNAGMSSVQYAEFFEMLDRINDNDNVSQNEFVEAARLTGISYDAGAALWATYNWKNQYPGY